MSFPNSSVRLLESIRIGSCGSPCLEHRSHSCGSNLYFQQRLCLQKGSDGLGSTLGSHLAAPSSLKHFAMSTLQRIMDPARLPQPAPNSNSIQGCVHPYILAYIPYVLRTPSVYLAAPWPASCDPPGQDPFLEDARVQCKSNTPLLCGQKLRGLGGCDMANIWLARVCCSASLPRSRVLLDASSCSEACLTFCTTHFVSPSRGSRHASCTCRHRQVCLEGWPLNSHVSLNGSVFNSRGQEA
jgi:hypothetical protein